MLISLHVKNLALIDETEVFFGKGLNILTGETGAGKSIIIGSIALALGAKAGSEMIRTGKEFALIELLFQPETQSQQEALSRLEIAPEEDGSVLVSRRIMSGRSVCKVNGETVTAKQLKELAGELLDLYGQHEHQTLLQKKKHMEILDDYAGEALLGIKRELQTEYMHYKKLFSEWNEAQSDNGSRQREISLAEFECNEIEAASLQIGEDETVENDYRRMSNGRKLMETVSSVSSLMENENSGVADAVGRALRELHGIAQYDKEAGQLAEQLQEIEELLHDFGRELSSYQESLEFDEQTFRETEDRLNEINRLKTKYGNTIEEILLYAKKQREMVERLADFDAYMERLQQELSKSEQQVTELCKHISELRTKAATELAQQMTAALHDLNFLDVKFEIRVEPDETAKSAEGYDHVGFYISTNPGEPLRPLENVASGGELSRIMLGLKTVMAQRDQTATLIFDEIDTGISGKTAWQVSKKLAVLGRNHQVLCITHLPQIAAMADSHFKIEKNVYDNQTVTEIRLLDDDEGTGELARLLGGDALTDAAIANAREMKELAADTKQY